MRDAATGRIYAAPGHQLGVVPGAQPYLSSGRLLVVDSARLPGLVGAPGLTISYWARQPIPWVPLLMVYNEYHQIGSLLPTLNTNGTFETADGWTLGAGWAVQDGLAVYTGGGGALSTTIAGLTYGEPVPGGTGTYYSVYVDLTNHTSGTLYAEIGGAAYQYTTSVVWTAAGEYRPILVRGTNQVFRLVPSAAGSCAVDNVWVAEAPVVRGQHHDIYAPQTQFDYVESNTWTHIAITCDWAASSNQIVCVANGQQRNAFTHSYPEALSGVGPTTLLECWAMTMTPIPACWWRDVRVYRRALTPAEIVHLYQRGLE